MRQIIVEGGNSLYGQVDVHSAKNSILPILAATVLADEEICLKNCPPLSDVKIMLSILESLGCKTKIVGKDIFVNPKNVKTWTIDDEWMGKLRSSIFILGPLIAKTGNAEIGYPGGCDIGIRPIDLHLHGLRNLGCSVLEKDGRIICRCGKLKGSEVYLDYPSVGATENIMMAATFADGATVIDNCAKEPEIVDLQNFINILGGRISGAGTGRIVVHGVKRLHGGEYTPIPDRIVTGTYLIATAITNGRVYIKNSIKEHVAVLLGKMKDCGCKMEYPEDGIIIEAPKRLVSSKMIETMPYPGFPTDLQSPMMALQTMTDGTCMLVENVFENRLLLSGELKKMGADITVKDRIAFIHGKEKLFGTNVDAHDLRGSAALIIAGLGAEGTTKINDRGYLLRGYYDLEKQLNGVGAKITVI